MSASQQKRQRVDITTKLGDISAAFADAEKEQTDNASDKYTQYKKELKGKDLRLALCIAGYAGLPTRDRHGNVVPDVWTQHGKTEEVSTQLLDVSAVRQMLQEQLKAHMEVRKEMLLDLDDPAIVAKWVVDFSTKWENEYRIKTMTQWDVSQMILTAMSDTVNEVAEVFDATGAGVSIQWMKDEIEKMYNSNNDAEKRHLYMSQQDAMVRALFRNESVGPMLQRIAGKILQKSIVCNKAGMYSAKIQRNDVTRERDNAIEAFVEAHFKDSPIFTKLRDKFSKHDELYKLCIDHTTSEPVVP